MTRLFAGTPWDRPPTCERCGKLESECDCPPAAVPPRRLPPETQTARVDRGEAAQGQARRRSSPHSIPKGTTCRPWLPASRPRAAPGAPSRMAASSFRATMLQAVDQALKAMGYKTSVEIGERTRRRWILHAMPVMLGVLAILAVAYRYYSAFLAARVAVLDDRAITPAHRFRDGQNFDPTNRWVLFGHHFAAISGAGPLIGPVLAIQFGYLPGLIWLVVGVCLAGAVQDMTVLAALDAAGRPEPGRAWRARRSAGRPGIAAALAILYIIIIALAGLGIVVVKALGGEESAA